MNKMSGPEAQNTELTLDPFLKNYFQYTQKIITNETNRGIIPTALGEVVNFIVSNPKDSFKDKLIENLSEDAAQNLIKIFSSAQGLTILLWLRDRAGNDLDVLVNNIADIYNTFISTSDEDASTILRNYYLMRAGANDPLTFGQDLMLRDSPGTDLGILGGLIAFFGTIRLFAYFQKKRKKENAIKLDYLASKLVELNDRHAQRSGEQDLFRVNEDIFYSLADYEADSLVKYLPSSIKNYFWNKKKKQIAILYASAYEVMKAHDFKILVLPKEDGHFDFIDLPSQIQRPNSELQRDSGVDVDPESRPPNFQNAIGRISDVTKQNKYELNRFEKGWEKVRTSLPVRLVLNFYDLLSTYSMTYWIFWFFVVAAVGLTASVALIPGLNLTVALFITFGLTAVPALLQGVYRLVKYVKNYNKDKELEAAAVEAEKNYNNKKSLINHTFLTNVKKVIIKPVEMTANTNGSSLPKIQFGVTEAEVAQIKQHTESFFVNLRSDKFNHGHKYLGFRRFLNIIGGFSGGFMVSSFVAWIVSDVLIFVFSSITVGAFLAGAAFMVAFPLIIGLIGLIAGFINAKKETNDYLELLQSAEEKLNFPEYSAIIHIDGHELRLNTMENLEKAVINIRTLEVYVAKKCQELQLVLEQLKAKKNKTADDNNNISKITSLLNELNHGRFFQYDNQFFNVLNVGVNTGGVFEDGLSSEDSKASRAWIVIKKVVARVFPFVDGYGGGAFKARWLLKPGMAVAVFLPILGLASAVLNPLALAIFIAGWLIVGVAFAVFKTYRDQKNREFERNTRFLKNIEIHAEEIALKAEHMHQKVNLIQANMSLLDLNTSQAPDTEPAGTRITKQTSQSTSFFGKTSLSGSGEAIISRVGAKNNNNTHTTFSFSYLSELLCLCGGKTRKKESVEENDGKSTEMGENNMGSSSHKQQVV